MSPRELILASAGSGKTFRISSRIIGLLARGEEPHTVFASTFTRKAAGEILDRVLVRLARAALDEDDARELASHALPGRKPAGAEDPSFWRDVLKRTMSALHRLDVGTLDAFFVRAVQSFAHDLELPPGWRIADEPTADRLRTEALDEMLEVVDGGVMVELLRALHEGEARRSVHSALARQADAILAVHLAIQAGAPGWQALRKVVGRIPDDLDARCAALGDRISAAPVPAKSDGDPDSRWVKARAKAAEQVRTREWSAFLSAGLYRKVRDTPTGEAPRYYRKPMPDPLAEALRDAADLARADLGPALAERAEAMERLARAYDEALMKRLLSAGRLRFEDVTRLLTGSTPLGGRADLFYRLDGAVTHLLLDEFQDTSLLQWRALTPLVDKLVGPPEEPAPGAAVVVADPKQSIYGWRGAAPVVVDELDRRYQLPRETMARSWRSSQVVLNAVNEVFEGLSKADVIAADDLDATLARAWLEHFQRHEAARELSGHVRLVAGPSKVGSGDEQPEICRFAAREVAGILQRGPGRSVGVLTRKNATVARMILELREIGVAASEEGGTPLTDSPAVVSVLALLRLTDHPGNGLARYHVASTPVGGAVGFTDFEDRVGAERVAGRYRRLLLHDGYGATLADLSTSLVHACDRRDQLRLRQLVELGYQYDGGAPTGIRIDDFVALARVTRAESPGHEPVRVMTVHRAKGLEFDAVVLPELHPNMFGRKETHAPLAYRPGGTGLVTHAYPPLSESLVELFDGVPEITGAWTQARAAQVRDALGSLYVAMTRARHGLHMVVPADGEGGAGTTRSQARLLRETLSDLPSDAVLGRGDVLHESGDPEWTSEEAAVEGSRLAGAPEGPERIRLRTGPRTRVLERRTPSSEEGGGAVDLASVLGIRGTRGMERGTLVHGWLETLTWIEEGLASPRELEQVSRTLAPTLSGDQRATLLHWLRESLKAPPVHAALSRENWPEGTLVERELPFLVRQGDALVEGYLDRLVLVPDDDGGVSRAQILDYKTDRIDPGDRGALRARVAYYAPQLRAYRDAVAALYGLEPEHVDAGLILLGPGVVEMLDDASPV